MNPRANISGPPRVRALHRQARCRLSLARRKYVGVTLFTAIGRMTAILLGPPYIPS